MAEWLKTSLIDIVELIGGGTPKTSKAEYWGGNINWLSVKDFNNENRNVYSTEKTITEEGLNNSSTKLLRKDDIIISARGTVGELAMIPFPMAFNQSCYGIRAKDGINSTFLYYLIKHSVRKLKSMTHGSVFDTITRDTFANIEVAIPDIETQQRIAKMLADIDDKVENNQRINNNLEQQAQAIYKAWFVDFSAFGGTAPNDWQTYHLVDFLPVITGKKNANVSSNQGKYPFFSCSQDYAWTDDYSFDGSAILVAGNGDFNVKFYSGKFEAYQRTYVLIPYEPKYTAWLFYAVQYHLSSITSAARGSVIKFITKGNLEDFEFVAPKVPLSLPVIYNLDTINRKIAANREENLRLGTLRDTLLPKLMSGELDVSNVEI